MIFIKQKSVWKLKIFLKIIFVCSILFLIILHIYIIIFFKQLLKTQVKTTKKYYLKISYFFYSLFINNKI